MMLMSAIWTNGAQGGVELGCDLSMGRHFSSSQTELAAESLKSMLAF
jgi:hypothetical protein